MAGGSLVVDWPKQLSWPILWATSLSLFLVGAISPVWAQRDLKNIPDPDPEIERKSFIVAEGMEVNLYAGDPLIAKPIQMNFDAQGRLWIASSEVYPQIKPGQPATDKILVLEDTNFDGQIDKTTVFAEGLLIPTGVIPGDGGCYVANSTELIHLRDTDGDGKADRRKVILSGFGTEDTHHLLHTLRWGPDGCLYMNQSIYIHSHVETPYGVKRLNGGGIWRFRPETLQLEVLCTGFVNTWGHHFDRYGQSFATDGAYGEGINYVFPGSVFVTAPGAVRRVEGLNPGSPKHCGLEIISGSHLPAAWQGNMITNDFRAHRVCRFVVSEDGSGYASRQEVEVIKSNHVAFRPIDVKMGPDGAIYVADWYNPIIQHGEVDFRDERRDHVHGRIWRISAKGRPKLDTRLSAKATPTELLNKLRDPEEWVRQHAKLMLKQHGVEAVAQPLAQWLSALDKTAPDYEVARLEGLWVYECLDLVSMPLVESLLKSPDHRVRAAAVRTVTHWFDQLPNAAAHLKIAVGDSHPRVRLEAVRGLSLVRKPEAAGWACMVLDQRMDRFLDFALWQTMRDLAPVWLPAVQAGSYDFGGRIDHLTFALKSADAPGVVGPLLKLVEQGKVPAERLEGILALAGSLGNDGELKGVLDLLFSPQIKLNPDQQANVIQSVIEGARLRKIKPAGDLNRLASFLDSDHDRLRGTVARAIGAWKIEGLRPKLVAILQEPTASETRLQGALDGLAALGGPESIKSISELAQRSSSVGTRIQAVEAVAALDVRLAAKLATEMLRQADAQFDATALVTLLVSQKGGPVALTDALANVELPADTAKMVLRGVRSSSQPSPALITAVQKAGKLENAGWKSSPELVQALVAEVASQGNPQRGEQVFRRKENQCFKCHGIGGAGGLVGPDLVSIGATAQVDYLIESLLVPTAKVKENFHSVLVSTDEGRIVTGIPVRETKTELVLRDAEDRLVTIGKNSIETRKEGRSLMPDGTADALTRTELVDLVRFLSELGKVGDYSLSQTRTARRWQFLPWNKDAHQRLNRTSHDSAAGDDPVFVWDPVYSQVNGFLPLTGLPQYEIHKGHPPVTFLRCELDATTAGKVRLVVNSAQGLALWVNGKPTPLTVDTVLDLSTGVTRLTLSVDRNARTEPIRLELQDVVGSEAKVQFVGGK